MKRFDVLMVGTVLAASLVALPSAWCEEVSVSESQGVNLTIYNQNFGVVKDVRSIPLKNGLNIVRFSDVAAQIDPTSVSLQSITVPNSLTVREQNYQYDLIDPNTILSKSIGKQIRFRQTVPNGQPREFTGILLNSPEATVADADGGNSRQYHGLVVKTDSGIVLNPAGEMEIAELPAGLISKPSLVWKLETNKPGTHKTEVAYQTQGINWKSDYVAILNKDDDQIDLNSWVTLDNKSGASYRDAALKLIAGDVHRVTPGAPQQMRFRPMPMAMNMSNGFEPQFKEESFAEYHMYSLQGKTDVLENETKQLSLFNADKVPAKKQFIYEPARTYWGANVEPQKIQVKIELDNTIKNGLGMPWPAGKVRVYKRDQDGSLQFIGEDQIDHTPKDEKIRLHIGEAFDLVGEKKMMHQDNIARRVQRFDYEVSLRNHKETPVTITFVEHPPGADWSILSSSEPYVKKDATTVEFPTEVKANSETKITYQIELRY